MSLRRSRPESSREQDENDGETAGRSQGLAFLVRGVEKRTASLDSHLNIQKKAGGAHAISVRPTSCAGLDRLVCRGPFWPVYSRAKSMFWRSFGAEKQEWNGVFNDDEELTVNESDIPMAFKAPIAQIRKSARLAAAGGKLARFV